MNRAPLLNEPDVVALLRDVRRTVALGKLTAFEDECHRLGAVVADRLLPAGTASEEMYAVAVANDLVSIHGEELIQALIAEGLA